MILFQVIDDLLPLYTFAHQLCFVLDSIYLFSPLVVSLLQKISFTSDLSKLKPSWNIVECLGCIKWVPWAGCCCGRGCCRCKTGMVQSRVWQCWQSRLSARGGEVWTFCWTFTVFPLLRLLASPDRRAGMRRWGRCTPLDMLPFFLQQNAPSLTLTSFAFTRWHLAHLASSSHECNYKC